MACNSTLAGLAAICASSDRISAAAALVTGMCGAACCMAISRIKVRLRIDDPVDAGAVHLGGGLAGTLIAGIFPWEYTDTTIEAQGEFQVLTQAFGLIAITAWTMLPIAG